jgi:hypothetical protein
MPAATAIKKFKNGTSYWYVKRDSATVREQRWDGMYPRGAKSTTYATPEIAHEHWQARVAKYAAQQAKSGAEREPRARIRDGKEDRGWISAGAAKPEFADFASWLRAQKP